MDTRQKMGVQHAQKKTGREKPERLIQRCNHAVLDEK
jgi:hypothetical protein